MKDFWDTGLASVEFPKAAAFSRVAQVVLGCPVTSASSERQFSYSKLYAQERMSHQTGFQLLHSCLQQIKSNKINKLKANQLKAPETNRINVVRLVAKRTF